MTALQPETFPNLFLIQFLIHFLHITYSFLASHQIPEGGNVFASECNFPDFPSLKGLFTQKYECYIIIYSPSCQSKHVQFPFFC